MYRIPTSSLTPLSHPLETSSLHSFTHPVTHAFSHSLPISLTPPPPPHTHSHSSPGLLVNCALRFSKQPVVINSFRNSACLTWKARAMQALDRISAQRRHNPNDALFASELEWAWFIEGGVVSKMAQMAEQSSGPTCNCFNGNISFWGGRSREIGTSRVLLGPKQNSSSINWTLAMPLRSAMDCITPHDSSKPSPTTFTFIPGRMLSLKPPSAANVALAMQDACNSSPGEGGGVPLATCL